MKAPTGTAEATTSALEALIASKNKNNGDDRISFIYSATRMLDSDLSITHRCEYNSSGQCRICGFHRG